MRADVACAAIDAVERAGRPLIYLSPRGLPLTQTRVTALSEGSRRAAGSRVWNLCAPSRHGRSKRSALVTSCWPEARSRRWPRSRRRCFRSRGVWCRGLPRRREFQPWLFEYPQYTRPQSFEGRDIPEVLSGRQPCRNRPVARRGGRRKPHQNTPSDLLPPMKSPVGYTPRLPVTFSPDGDGLMNQLKQLEAEQM